MSADLWEVRALSGGLALELCGGDKPGLVLVEGNDQVKKDLVHRYGCRRPVTRVSYPG
jgi:hypothetical protein